MNHHITSEYRGECVLAFGGGCLMSSNKVSCEKSTIMDAIKPYEKKS